MKRIAFLFLIFFHLFILPRIAVAQLSKFIAIDANGGLYTVDFTTPSPTVTQISASAYTFSEEDMNLMTDSDNNILFSYYAHISSGTLSVRDVNFNVMPNGAGVLASSSSSQSCITPKPCSESNYFIIHLDVSRTLYYSEVDMTLNGGLGDVLNKNNLLGTTYSEAFSVSHQLPTGCRWLFTAHIVGSSYEITRFLISTSGISSPVVIATVNLPSGSYPYPIDMELSADNSKLAISTLQANAASPDVIVWDLDLIAGTISNQQSIFINLSNPTFSIEFSPDNSKIYYRTNSAGSNEELGRINLQTNLDTVIATGLPAYQAHLETAGNGKIYMTSANSQGYSEIANPNAADIANVGYTYAAVPINSVTRPGIPHAIDGEPPQTAPKPTYIAFSNAVTANCNEFIFQDTSCLATWWQWDFGDGTFSNTQIPTHQYLSAGTYDVTLKTLTCDDTLTLIKPNLITTSTGGLALTINADTSVCLGQSVAINATAGFTTYTWSPTVGLNCSTCQNPTASPSVTTTYSVIGSLNGCFSSASFVIQVNTIFSSPLNTSTICSGASAVLSATPGNNSYQWLPSTGLSCATCQTTSASPIVTTTYYSQMNNGGCAAADTFIVNVVSVPVLSVSNNSTLCSGQTVGLTASGGFTSYSWSPSSSLNTSTNASVFASPTITTTYIITGTIGNNCFDDTTVVITVFSATVFSSPGQTMCEGDSVVLTANGVSSYEWSPAIGLNSSTGFSVTASPSSSTTYTVTGTDANGCTAVSTTPVTVNSVSVLIADETICENETVMLFASGAANYVWSPATDLSASTGAAVTANPDSTTIYTITGTDNSGCADTALVTITVNSAPVLLVSNDTFICPLTVVQLFVSGATDYVWSPFSGLTNSTSSNPLANPVISTTYTITGNNSFGCVDTAVVEVDVKDYPAVTVTYDSTSYCHAVIQLYADGLTGYEYSWEPGSDFSNANALDPIVSPTVNTTYSLLVTDADGCVFSYPVAVQYSQSDAIAIPNAFSPNGDGYNDFYKILYTCNFVLESFRIYNRWGQLIFETADINEGWDGTFYETKCGLGVYAYVVVGHTYQSERMMQNGNVTLLR